MEKYYTTSYDKMGKILILISSRVRDEDKRQRKFRDKIFFFELFPLKGNGISLDRDRLNK